MKTSFLCFGCGWGTATALSVGDDVGGGGCVESGRVPETQRCLPTFVRLPLALHVTLRCMFFPCYMILPTTTSTSHSFERSLPGVVQA